METTDRELTYYEIIKLVKKSGYDCMKLKVYSIDVLREWRRTMSVIPYDIQNGNLEIHKTVTSILSAIKIKENPWGIEEEPEEDVKGKLIQIDNGNKGIKNLRELTKDDIDRMYDAAKEMLYRDFKVKDGKVIFKKTPYRMSPEEKAKKDVTLAACRTHFSGTSLVLADFWFNHDMDEINKHIDKLTIDEDKMYKIVEKMQQDCNTDHNKYEYQWAKLKRLRRMREQLEKFKNTIEYYDEQKRLWESA